MSSRAVEDSRKTGRGSCGSGAPRGVSTQIRQALMRPANAASLEIECLSVIFLTVTARGICAWAIANAWFDDTRYMPTISRNTGALRGCFDTHFQRYLAEAAALRRIGLKVTQNAVDAFGTARRNEESCFGG